MAPDALRSTAISRAGPHRAGRPRAARRAGADLLCPLCLEALAGAAELHECPACRTSVHRGCLVELGGCPTLGCALRGQPAAGLAARTCSVCQEAIPSELRRRRCPCGAALHGDCVAGHRAFCAEARTLSDRRGPPRARPPVAPPPWEAGPAPPLPAWLQPPSAERTPTGLTDLTAILGTFAAAAGAISLPLAALVERAGVIAWGLYTLSWGAASLLAAFWFRPPHRNLARPARLLGAQLGLWLAFEVLLLGVALYADLPLRTPWSALLLAPALVGLGVAASGARQTLGARAVTWLVLATGSLPFGLALAVERLAPR